MSEFFAQVSAINCGFNWWLQYLISSSGEEDVAYEAPEQIAGWLKRAYRDNEMMFCPDVSVEYFYRLAA